MIIDRPVGIDLGTTNSEIALLDPSERDIHVHEDRFGRRTVPSAVAWDPKTEAFLVGRAARARRGKEPAPIESVKRSMGRATKHRCGPHELSPEEVSAKILGELHARMQEDMTKRVGAGTEVRVNRAVITVPAYFDAPQVEATRRAGELAGLDVIGIVQEPTAAAIYHTWKQRLGDGIFLVYDLGGGTFDVSILRCLGGEYQVLAIDGDNYLGGDDLDRRLAEHLRATLETRGYALKLDPEGDPQDAARWTRLVHLAQEIKETLSTSSVVNLSRDDVLVDQAGESVSLELELGRAEYDALIGDLVDTTIERCRGALAQSSERAQVSLADVDHVVLVGGSTRVPLVRQRVREALCSGSKCDTPLADEVDTCVALGAAVHAAQLGGIRLEEGELALAIKSPLVTQSAKLRLVLEVERAPEAAVSLRVEDSGGAELAGVELGESGARLRLEVALGEREETPIRIVAADGAGAELAAVSLALYRGALAPRPSALSQPSVISKDISLEVVRAGRREQRVLLARGTSVPAQVEHELATGDRSGAVVLRVMQDRLPIKTLLLEIPEDTEVGTAVRISLSCDDAMRLEAKAQVAGRELWARIEASALDTPDRAAIAALLAETERAASRLWGREATSFRREADPLVTGLREIAFSDPGRAAVLAARLRELIDHFGAEEGELSPPITRFEQVLDALRRAVWRSGGAILNMDASAWEVRIADLDDRARSAWDARDPDEWRRAYNEAQALYETATTQEHATARVDDPAYVAKRVIGVRAWMGDLEARLEDFVPSANSEVRDKQVGERNKLLTEVRERVRPRLMALAQGEPSMHEMRRTVDTLASELERVEAALERLPTLGLVTDKK